MRLARFQITVAQLATQLAVTFGLGHEALRSWGVGFLAGIAVNAALSAIAEGDAE